MASAIYCRNGHFVDYVPERDPRLQHVGVWHDWQERTLTDKMGRLAFCSNCGAESIQNCQNCKATIERDPFYSSRPSYCGACGKPFPWMEAALQAAQDYTDELEELSAEDKVILKKTFRELTIDTPQTPVAANRYNRILKKATSTVGKGLRTILVDVMSETAAKLIDPQR